MIRTLLQLSWINLRRDRTALTLTFVLPIVFFSIFAGVFGEMDRGSLRPLSAVVVAEDLHPASLALAERLRREPSLQIVSSDSAPDRSSAERLVRGGTASVAVLLPEGFGRTLSDPDRTAGAPVELLLDRSHPVAGGLVQGVVQAAVFDLAIKAQGSAVEPIRFVVSDGAGGKESSAKRPSIAFFASGIGVMFLLFAVSGRSAILIEEREHGVLTRLLATRIGMTRLLVARWLYLTILGFAQVTLMFVWAALIFGLELWTVRHLTGFTAITAVTAGAAAGFGLLLSTACRTRAQLNGIAAVVVLTLSALGGSLFPSFMMPPWLQNVGRLTFNAWALEGYQNIFWYDASLTEQLPQIAVVAAYGLAFLVAVRILARRWQAI